jgi:hypothetical protein
LWNWQANIVNINEDTPPQAAGYLRDLCFIRRKRRGIYPERLKIFKITIRRNRCFHLQLNDFGTN